MIVQKHIILFLVIFIISYIFYILVEKPFQEVLDMMRQKSTIKSLVSIVVISFMLYGVYFIWGF
jgi:hypothetical protein